MSSEESKSQAVDGGSVNKDPNQTQDEEADTIPTICEIPNDDEPELFIHPKMNNIFGFIDSLSSKLPNRQVTDGKPPVRRTSDLLDTLQKALLSNPPSQRITTSNIASKSTAGLVPNRFDPKTHFGICIDIRRAARVTKIPLSNKKPCSMYQHLEEKDASTYITFQAHGPSKVQVNSKDGLVFTTKVVENTSSPEYNTRFNVALPLPYIQSVYKRFILKMWRKLGNESPDNLVPDPCKDILFGNVYVNLTQLADKSGKICEWFSVTDSHDRLNARILLGFTAMENIDRFRKIPVESKPKTNVGQNILPLEFNLTAEANSLLNLALKRKFTELEDITKRLKARLIDVTDDAAFDGLEDDFDAELNTLPEEDDADDGFDWLEAIAGRNTAGGESSNENEPGQVSMANNVAVEENKTEDAKVESGISGGDEPVSPGSSPTDKSENGLSDATVEQPIN